MDRSRGLSTLDHARFAIGAAAARRFTATAAWRAMEAAITEHGAPRQLISDNGTQFISTADDHAVRTQLSSAVLRRQSTGRPELNWPVLAVTPPSTGSATPVM
jgi:transposase InsO family protein